MSRYHNPYETPSTFARIRPILLIVLVLVAAFLIFQFAGVGGVTQTRLEEQRASYLRNEVNMAVSSVNSLSRLGSSSSGGMLGRVRQHVHGAEVINDFTVSLLGEGGRIYPVTLFEEIYRIIEEYELRLSSGQKVNDTLTALSEAVNQLSAQTSLALQ